MNINWKEWLPPANLPDTGKKDLLVGQVWAWRCKDIMTEATCAAVVRICNPNLSLDQELLADNGASGIREHVKSATLFFPHGRARFAILVQDVGQEEPTDPDLLYQFLYK